MKNFRFNKFRFGKLKIFRPKLKSFGPKCSKKFRPRMLEKNSARMFGKLPTRNFRPITFEKIPAQNVWKKHIVEIGLYYKKLMVLHENLDLRSRFKMSNFDILNKKIGWGDSKNEWVGRFPYKFIWKKISSIWFKRFFDRNLNQYYQIECKMDRLKDMKALFNSS